MRADLAPLLLLLALAAGALLGGGRGAYQALSMPVAIAGVDSSRLRVNQLLNTSGKLGRGAGEREHGGAGRACGWRGGAPWMELQRLQRQRLCIGPVRSGDRRCVAAVARVWGGSDKLLCRCCCAASAQATRWACWACSSPPSSPCWATSPTARCGLIEDGVHSVAPAGSRDEEFWRKQQGSRRSISSFLLQHTS